MTRIHYAVAIGAGLVLVPMALGWLLARSGIMEDSPAACHGCAEVHDG